VIQLLVPALVVIIVALAITRNRPRATQGDASQPISIGALIGLITIAAALTIGLVWALHVSMN
jgi:hypothetical protein